MSADNNTDEIDGYCDGKIELEPGPDATRQYHPTRLHPAYTDYSMLYQLITDHLDMIHSQEEQRTFTFTSLAPILRTAIRCPFHPYRLDVLRLLSRLASDEQSDKNDPSTSISKVFGILLEAEECAADFHHYRERGQIIRQLKFIPLMKIFKSNTETVDGNDKRPGNQELIAKIVLDWLLSQFYESFTLYWPLLVEPIESYAQGMSEDAFWDCFREALDQAWTRIHQAEEKEGVKEDGTNEALPLPPPDYSAYRLQLLRLLTKLPIAVTKVEQMTRYLAPKFIHLYRSEFMHFDEISVVNESPEHLDKDTAYDDGKSMEGVRAEEMDLDEHGSSEEARSELEGKFHRPLNFFTRRRGTLNAVKAMLTLFSRFTNPRGVFREPEILNIYYELLLINEPEIQRLVLSCLLTYRHSWLGPYRESLEGLLDEKRMRDQLVLFSVDGQQAVAMASEKHGRTVGRKASRAVPLLEEHRAKLMPILLRILYGSLHTHVARRGKAKRMAIFRFLANCLPHELGLFLHLLFGPLISLFEFTSENTPDVVRSLEVLGTDKRPIVQSISLNKLKSVLGTLTDVFRLLGPALDDGQLSLLFTALLLSAKAILLRNEWLRGEEEEEDALVGGEEARKKSPLDRQLKNLRLLCIQTFIKFFGAFQSRPSLPLSAIPSLFHHFIVPLIQTAGGRFVAHDEEGDEVEGGRGTHLTVLPASVCRLFCFWTRIARFHPFLNVPLQFGPISDESPGEEGTIASTPFSLLCDQLLFLSPGSKPKPIHMEILHICNKLLSSSSKSDGEEREEDSSNNLLSLAHLQTALLPQTELDAAIGGEDSLGARLVLSNSAKIVEHLSRVVRGNEQRQKTAIGSAIPTRRTGPIPSIYFDLLNRLASHIHRPELAVLFAETLLHFISNKRGRALRLQQPEKAQKLLATLTVLSAHLEKPVEAVSLLGPLFSQLDGRQLREPLTRLVCSLAPHFPPNCREFFDLLDSLESWDPRKIGEPDSDRRCQALLSLYDIYDERRQAESPLLIPEAIHLIPLLAHSHVHAMVKSSDLSLRGTAANCFRQLVVFVAGPSSLMGVDSSSSSRFLHSHLLPLVLRGLKTSNEGGTAESIRHEFVQCLVQLLRSFPNEPHLAPLRAVAGPIEAEEGVADPDLNFFEAATHIQAHRRQRAFHRLAERLNTGDELCPARVGHQPLLNYILPLIEPCLMETAPSRSALADQALNLLSAILRRCPWPKYQKLLEHFLRQVDSEERTKAAIRVVVAILDAFHFDVRDWRERRTRLGGKEAEEEEGQCHPPDEEEVPDPVPAKGEKEKQRIYALVTRKLLPRLRALLSPRQLNSHRRAQQFAAKSFQHEDEKLIRAPLVIAAVKLLKWMPSHVEGQNLHSYLATLNHLLMSRSSSVRQGARKLMVQLVKLLGPGRLPFVVRELKQTLCKGYQVHVMVFTVLTLIGALEGEMRSGDLDPCLEELIEVCKWQTFGNEQLEREDEEKGTGQAGTLRSDSHGVPEAKGGGSRTVETFTQIGRFLGSERALDEAVLGQIRKVVESSPKAETLRTLGDWLRALALGLRQNRGGIGPLEQLKFALRTARANLRQMALDQERLNGARGGAEGRQAAQRPQNCLLLAPEPKRLGIIRKVALKSRAHIFVEFALQLLADKLKARSAGAQTDMALGGTGRGEEDGQGVEGEEVDEEGEDSARQVEQVAGGGEGEEVSKLLEQFGPLIMDALGQKYDKVIALALCCLLHLLKQHPGLLEQRHSELVDRLFAILADYAAMGQAGNRPVVLELQQNLFKCFTQLIRTTPLAAFGANRMELLLNHMETDILDSHKQTTAFNLMKAVIGRKVEEEKVASMVEYLSETAITSSSSSVRSQCRQVVLLYLTVHPRGQREFEQWMEFFLNQAEYELEEGRLSALDMVHSILSQFTEEANARLALFAYMKLLTRLLNDPSERCRQLVALCLRKLFNSVTAAAFNDLHAATNDWLATKKASVQLLALHAFSQLVLSDSPHFSPALWALLVRRVGQEFSRAKGGTFSNGTPISTKLALCQLLRAIAEKKPLKLLEELAKEQEEEGEGLELEAGKRMRAKKCRARESSSSIRQRWQELGQFFANLMDCLVACRRPAPPPLLGEDGTGSCTSSPSAAEQMRLSLAAQHFLAQWMAHRPAREALVRHLLLLNDAPADPQEEGCPGTTRRRTLLFLLCLDQVLLLDSRPSGKADGLDWDDTLAELATRLLAQLLPSLQADQFEPICRRLSKICWAEASKEPDKARKRLCILKLVGLLAAKWSVEAEQFGQLCTRFMPLLHREMGKKSPKYTEELSSSASEVAEQFRRQLGSRDFSARLAKCQRESLERAQQRKQEEKARLITDPAAAIEAKQKRHQRKRTTKQRRLDALKPQRAFKRRRREEAVERAASPSPV